MTTFAPSPGMKVFRLVTLVSVSAIGVWMLIAGGPKWYYSLVLFSMVGAQAYLIHLERKVEQLKEQLGQRSGDRHLQ